MKKLLLLCVFSSFAHTAVFAADSHVRVTCEEKEKGADVILDDEYKGRCPIDFSTKPGTHKLEVVAKNRGEYAFVHTIELVLGSGVLQKIEVPSVDNSSEWTSFHKRKTPLLLLIRSAKSGNPVAKAELKKSYQTDPKGCYFQFSMPEKMKGSITSWSGTCKEGAGSGPGELVWTAEDIPAYGRSSGTFVQGRLEGKGTESFHGGQSFNGMFVNGMKSRPGVQTYLNGDRYEIDSAGKEILFKKNGDRYEGETLYGTMHGKGVLTRADGTRVAGEFNFDKFVGPN